MPRWSKNTAQRASRRERNKHPAYRVSIAFMFMSSSALAAQRFAEHLGCRLIRARVRGGYDSPALRGEPAPPGIPRVTRGVLDPVPAPPARRGTRRGG